MKALRTFLAIGVVVAVLEWSYVGSAGTNMPPVRLSIPYVVSRNDAVQDMLWMANVGKDDVVYDLGSGDGRIVIAAVHDFSARRAVGIEMAPERIRQSRENAQKAGVTDRVEFIHGDLFTNDFRQASVITLFLGHQPNIKLRTKMLSILKPGTRIVSHQFNMGEWQPDKTQTVRTVYFGMYGTIFSPFSENLCVPDYTGNELDPYEGDRIFMWVVPAPVAGIWRAVVETAQGQQNLQLTLHQRLSKVSGRFQLSGKTSLEGHANVDLWGNHMRFWCTPAGMPYGQLELRFDGHVHGNTMKGTLAVRDRGDLSQSQWQAQRDKVDYTGTWEWSCATGTRSVRLRIEQHDGHLIATYLDRDQALPVTDFYDFGGGFYFTLLIGRKANSVRMTEDTGWLIGKGLLENGQLKGTIEFYPYGDMPDMAGERKTSQAVIRDWAPRLIKP
ncbi:MAG: methyltransferase domain-containing protein [Sedimentisphaerales bacterium]|nr:methyltransferase domain-containing protein [Sedimentisphaerales bacterium]